MEADKTVSTQIDVSEITTSFTALATQIVPMPVCRYEILDGGPSGQPIQYGLIGQQKRAADYDNTLDVRTDISALDISDQNQALPADLRHRARQQFGHPIVLSPTLQDGICMSPMGLSMMMGIGVVLIAAFVVLINYIQGEPEIECGPTSITVNFNTRNPFDGHVYVKGLYDQEGCRNDETGRNIAGISLPFDSCNVARTRSLNPRGIFVTATVVISFHPLFVTKVDRAYRIQCFYMEADKTVSTQIEVSEITTAFATQIVPMPICRYEILDGGPTGQPIQYGLIGQQVYHKWTCDTETVDTFCAVVHSCFVDDGNGDKVELLNEEGCALDKHLLNNLEYPTDLMAGQEAHIYKYADRSQLFYQCQIRITIKEPNSECERPKCSEPQGFGAVRFAND
ncbi:unnamed protein product [Anisakis simplex]|uniref:ZP domain-containing protein n=1 Tax=Anisakis simplex TaxID=6269 RepID=A0A0M3K150_ANISI|nr:unnamed protein product [Anisakis simplex]